MNDPGRQHKASALALTFRAFKYRNYRLFFGGQCISLIGTWMQMVALSWLVYRLTGSTVLLGVTGFANQIPSLLLAPFGSLLAGWAASRLGVAYTIALSGGCVLVATAFFISKLDKITAHAAPSYSRMGLREMPVEDIREASVAGRSL